MSDLSAVELESFLLILAAPLLVVPWIVWCGWCWFCDWEGGL